jgi:hypothetical protein
MRDFKSRDEDVPETTPTETAAKVAKSATVRLTVRERGITSISCAVGSAEVDADGGFEVSPEDAQRWLAATDAVTRE